MLRSKTFLGALLAVSLISCGEFEFSKPKDSKKQETTPSTQTTQDENKDTKTETTTSKEPNPSSLTENPQPGSSTVTPTLPTPTPTPTPIPRPPENIEDFVHFKVLPLEKPYEYQILIEAEFPMPIEIKIYLEAPNLTHTFLFESNDSHLQYIFTRAKSEEHLVFVVEEYFLNSKISEMKKEITLPKDIVLNSTYTLKTSERIEAHRIFLENNIFIGPHTLTLISEELFAKNANIQTYKTSTLPQPRPETLNGGNIFIRSKTAKGELNISLIGIEGKPGTPGADNKAVPPNGRPGTNGKVDVIETPPCIKDPVTNSKECRTKLICSSQPTKGEPGQKGYPGFPGLPGEPGGDSGGLDIIIDNSAELDLNTKRTPGVGGKGGIGGKGGLGSIHGNRGESPDPCPNPGDSTDGEPGDRGTTGLDGLPGNENPFCISRNSEKQVCY